MSRSILLYGDVNPAYRDGSRIWLESVADVLVRTGSTVTLLLKALPPDEAQGFGRDLPYEVVAPLAEHRSRAAGMTVSEARTRIVDLDGEHAFDIILTRGYEIARELSTEAQLHGRLWPYLTDGPGFDLLHGGHARESLATIADSARRVLVQTEDARSMFEACVPAATGKTLVLPPMVPDVFFADPTAVGADRGSAEDPLRLVYSGKFARAWRSLDIPRLPGRLENIGVHSRLTMIGDKIHHSSTDRSFPVEMRALMAEKLEHVRWEGGVDRSDALGLLAAADVGLSWRESSLDTSLELSTKLLEYAASGVPPVVNRTRAHERLLGADYPLFVDADVVDALVRACDGELRHHAARVAYEAVQQFRFSRCAARLSRYFEAVEPDLDVTPRLPSPRAHGPLRVLFSSHDFKFAGELLDALEQREDIELRVDRWHRLAQHDPEASADAGDWADVIICEWAGHNAVFHSRRKREDQRLIVRFHGFEIRGHWLSDIVVEAVDAFVFVSDFYRRQILETTGWPESRTTVIPNVVDVIDLDREKLPAARFHLGMAGYVPMLKRPDRALDLLERLAREDDRYLLHIRGRAPWDYPWEWAKPVQRNAYEALLDKVRSSAMLRSRVLFEEFSPDMGSWFRGIGWALSPSVHETFHLAPAEGMASGAVPLVWERPGASEIFRGYVYEDLEDIAQEVLRTADDPGLYQELSSAARQRAGAFDMSEHRRSWLDLLDTARSTPLPLRGKPLIETVPPSGPENPAQVAAIIEHAASAGEERHALAALASPAAAFTEGSYIGTRLTALHEEVLLEDGLRNGFWLPPGGLGPIVTPRRVRNAHLQDEDAQALLRLDAAAIIDPVDLAATPVLTAADALVTAARKERAGVIDASPDPGGLIATAIAARRLGIELHLGAAGEAASTALDRAHPRLWAELQSGLEHSPEPLDLSELTIGLVADAFTTNALSSAVATVAIPRHGWEEVLRAHPVDAILVESAWSSPSKEWFHGVAYHGPEDAADLQAIISHARSHGIPTLFWNREDPVHLRSFRIPASDFDAVLTSDANCIPEYLSTLPAHTRVAASLPFFSDPSVMHPVAQRREDGATATAYAGTYYGERFPERSRELRTVLAAAADAGLTIYDRQATVANSSYPLPPDLQEFSRGGVPAESMPDVYRRHPIHLNVNSVTESPTMFSRRVVEIAASGALVLSGQGEGVRTTLGPDFPVLVDEQEWRTALRSYSEDPELWRDAVWKQLRVVRRAFTTQRALTYALRVAGLPVRAPQEARYALLAPASLADVAGPVLSQTLLPEAVALPAGHPDTGRLLRSGIHVVDLPEAAADLSILIDDSGFVGVLDPQIPSTHYEDLLYAASFGDWDRLVARTDPAPGDDPFSIVSCSPPTSAAVAGGLYARRIARNAEELGNSSDERSFVWVRGAGDAAIKWR